MRGGSFKPRPLGSHVAVRDGPSPARLTHCLAGVDYRLEDHQRRGQHLQPPRRRWFSSSCGRFATNGVASLQMVDLRRSWVILFQGSFEIGYSEAQLWWPCDFACLPARCPAALIEVVRRPSARMACNGIPCRAVGPIGIRCAPPDAARNGRALWKAAPRWRKGGGTVEGCFGAWVKWALCWFLCRSL